MKLSAHLILFLFGVLTSFPGFCLDHIPGNFSDWHDEGVVLEKGPNGAWDSNSDHLECHGIILLNNTYYLYYEAGSPACKPAWPKHQAIGVALSNDGKNFTKYSGNPIIHPSEATQLSSDEEGFRAFTVYYYKDNQTFYLYASCDEGGATGCDISVDANIHLWTSRDGKDFDYKGKPDGVYAGGNAENHAASVIVVNDQILLYSNRAQGGMRHSVSRAPVSSPKNFDPLGEVPLLNFGWSQAKAFLHDDQKTLTFIYQPSAGRDGCRSQGAYDWCRTGEIYMATGSIDNPTDLHDERLIVQGKKWRINMILKDTQAGKWRWYYSDVYDGQYNHRIGMATSHLDNSTPIKRKSDYLRKQPAPLNKVFHHNDKRRHTFSSVNYFDLCGRQITRQNAELQVFLVSPAH